MNERRQRTARGYLAGLITLGALVLAGGCQARSSAEGAQTAIAVAQTALPAVQTGAPGLQATALAGATTVSGLFSDPQAITTQMQALLVGSSLDVTTSPTGVANDEVTDVQINANDTRGTLAQLDQRSRQVAATAAMVLAAQYYPNATIALTVVDGSGARLVGGSRAPGQAPSVQ